MTGTDTALLLAIAGGAVVAVGVGAIAGFLMHRFAFFEQASRDAAEQRVYAVARIEEGIANAARATLAAQGTRHAVDSMRADLANAQSVRALTGRRATFLRLRHARARYWGRS